MERIIEKHKRLLLACIGIIVLLGMDCCVYYKPPYKGQVIDSESQMPIDNVVVVAIYYRSVLLDRDLEPISTKEYVTGADGLFYFPSHITLISPITTIQPTNFIIFKPGYGHYTLSDINPRAAIGRLGRDEFFRESNFGKKKELVLYNLGVLTSAPDAYGKYTANYGIAKLQRLDSIRRSDVLMYLPAYELPYPLFNYKDDLPQFIKAIQDGEAWLKKVKIQE